MREIKFRAWDDGKMVYSDQFQDDRNYSEYDYLRFFFERIRGNAKVMQFTGLKDKNGKEIYEGDIVRYSDDSDIAHYKIEWWTDACMWGDVRIEDGESQTAFDGFDTFRETEVIGNIHENPELL